MISNLEDWQKKNLNADGAYEIKVGMSRGRTFDMLKSKSYVVKNNNYTLVLVTDDTFGQYIGDVILIKN